MDRRQALRRIAAGGTATVAGATIVSSRAFADGGSLAGRPSPSGLFPSFASVDGQFIDTTSHRVPIALANSGAQTPVACPNGAVATVQRRFAVTITIAGTTGTLANAGLFSQANGGVRYDGNFTTESGSAGVPSQVILRRFNDATRLTSGRYDIYLVVRYVCRLDGRVWWACRQNHVTFSITGPDTGPNADQAVGNRQFRATTGPPVDTANCDAPPP